MCVPVRGFIEDLVSYLQTKCLENNVLIISYIIRVLSIGYEVTEFTKRLKWYKSPHACISNIKSRKKRIEPHSCKLEKGEGRKK